MQTDLVVLGLGYVGLPLAQEAVKSGLGVLGFDISKGVVEGLNGGRSHVDDLSDDDVAQMLAGGFRATTEESEIAAADVAVICVPTPLSAEGSPDLGPVIAAGAAVGRQLRAGMTVILQSTTYPGTTDEVLVPLLEEGSGLTAGEDFHVAFSPERIDPGNERFGMRNTPKVVGGVTPACTAAAVGFYERFVDTVVAAKGTREAEMSKLLENTYRHINIALVNEMARFAHELDIDFWNVIDMAKTKPFGFQAFYPGVGVGGHCIPIDPNYLSYNVRTRLGYPFRFVELAQEINATMPAYVARRAQDILNDDGIALRGSKVLLLGVTYKPDIADQRESPAVPLAKQLQSMGAEVSFHDPNVTTWHVNGQDLTPVADLDTAVAGVDLVILIQNHREFDLEHLAATAERFLDTKGKVTTPGAHRL